MDVRLGDLSTSWFLQPPHVTEGENIMTNVPAVSSLATTYVRVAAYTDANGVPTNPSSLVVEMAFIPAINNSVPQVSDWKVGSWTQTAQGGYVAQCLIGPSGTIALTAGTTYNVWIQIQASPETVIENVGQIQITQ